MSAVEEAKVEQFNNNYPLGTPVRFWPGFKQGEGREGKTRTPAWVMGGHTAVVSITDYPGGIALTHVEVVGVEEE